MSKITLKLFGSERPEAGYIAWSPVPLTIERASPSDGTSVILKSSPINKGSIPRVVFMDKVGAVPTDEIKVNFGSDNTKMIYVAGKFQPEERHNGASEDGKDIKIEAAWDNKPQDVVGCLEVMIRVRKDANELSEKARNDFLKALASLNGIKESDAGGAGKGIYVTDFVGMHVEGAGETEHGDSHFLPWHRLYLLDLERLLQKVNPAVSLPYWRFDKPAPNLFTKNFMGETETIPNDTELTPGTSEHCAEFSSSNPIFEWKIEDVPGISRSAYFDTKKEAAQGIPAAVPNQEGAFRLIKEVATLALGGTNEPEFGTRRRGSRDGFSEMEGTPHGAAHTSFNGYINSVPVAPKDPLFFLLHCNVDRLWALWQFIFYRDAVSDKRSYPYQKRLEIIAQSDGLITGSFPDHYKVVDAPQWPWDSSFSKPGNLRPPGTRSGNFTESSLGGKDFSNRPPSLADAIDAYGFHDPSNNLGIAYDDVPFGHDRPIGQAAKIITQGSENQVMIISDYRRDLLDEIKDFENQGEVIDQATKKILEIARDPNEVDKLIKIINDSESSINDQVSAIDTLNNVSNFSPQVRSRLPEIINALRGMMTSPYKPLRIRALATLAMRKDEIAQELLTKELESDKEEKDKLVSTSMAISMLGRDEKAIKAPLLLKIAAKPPTPESFREAIRHIPAALDSESFQILQKINNSRNRGKTTTPSDVASSLVTGVVGVTNENAEVEDKNKNIESEVNKIKAEILQNL
ncbi:MAG: tyrosinase family protein [Cyanobacteria bacterium P01_F01_bin.143]